jgi:enoyl-CoA hydratase/carnithine racemase
VERGESDEGVVTVTLNRPDRRNAINARMSLELLDVFREIAA